MDAQDLARLSRVCVRLWKLAGDKTLWEKVDLSAGPLTLQQLWKLLRSRLTSSLKALKIRGFAKIYPGSPRWKTESVSPSFMIELSKRSSNLQDLYLQEMYFPEKINISHIPPWVVTLSLRGSQFASSLAWFSSNHSLQKLKHLDICKCVGITQKAFVEISKLTSVEVLCLNDCYNVNNTTIKILSQSLIHLKHLDVRGTNITDNAIITIGQYLDRLEDLQLGGVPGNSESTSRSQSITDNGLLGLGSAILCLVKLNISSTSITNETLRLLGRFYPNLKCLNVTNTFVTHEGTKEFKDKLAHCNVIFDR